MAAKDRLKISEIVPVYKSAGDNVSKWISRTLRKRRRSRPSTDASSMQRQQNSKVSPRELLHRAEQVCQEEVARVPEKVMQDLRTAKDLRSEIGDIYLQFKPDAETENNSHAFFVEILQKMENLFQTHNQNCQQGANIPDGLPDAQASGNTEVEDAIEFGDEGPDNSRITEEDDIEIECEECVDHQLGEMMNVIERLEHIHLISRHMQKKWAAAEESRRLSLVEEYYLAAEIATQEISAQYAELVQEYPSLKTTAGLYKFFNTELVEVEGTAVLNYIAEKRQYDLDFESVDLICPCEYDAIKSGLKVASTALEHLQAGDREDDDDVWSKLSKLGNGRSWMILAWGYYCGGQGFVKKLDLFTRTMMESIGADDVPGWVLFAVRIHDPLLKPGLEKFTGWLHDELKPNVNAFMAGDARRMQSMLRHVEIPENLAGSAKLEKYGVDKEGRSAYDSICELASTLGTNSMPGLFDTFLKHWSWATYSMRRRFEWDVHQFGKSIANARANLWTAAYLYKVCRAPRFFTGNSKMLPKWDEMEYAIEVHNKDLKCLPVEALLEQGNGGLPRLFEKIIDKDLTKRTQRRAERTAVSYWPAFMPRQPTVVYRSEDTFCQLLDDYCQTALSAEAQRALQFPWLAFAEHVVLFLESTTRVLKSGKVRLRHVASQLSELRTSGPEYLPRIRSLIDDATHSKDPWALQNFCAGMGMCAVATFNDLSRRREPDC